MTTRYRSICLAPGRAAPGMTLARTIADREGNTLLIAGTELDLSMLERLTRRGVNAISVLIPDTRDADAVLRRLQCFPLLEGYRGRKGADIPKLLELLAALQRLVLDVPEIAELDVNPLIWDGDRFVVADARIRIE